MPLLSTAYNNREGTTAMQSRLRRQGWKARRQRQQQLHTILHAPASSSRRIVVLVAGKVPVATHHRQQSNDDTAVFCWAPALREWKIWEKKMYQFLKVEII
jgi:hypothetical protein